jgi:uncharacterized protein YhaN
VKIKRLYIGDMGIYKNALMEDINSNIVVIGGMNRSGKTTLMETLRHMAYGFPKNLRDDSGDYYVESDMIDEYNNKYTLKVSGLKEPQLRNKYEDKIISVREFYGNVDRFTYSQLYTITLNELKRAAVKAEEEKLQSVLLGAGLKDIVHIPKLVEEFKKEKEKIGGKQGNPNTKLFKGYYDNLLDGISNRDEALKQLEEYENKCQNLKGLDSKIDSFSNEIYELNHKITAFEMVKAYYNQYKEKIELELQLEAMDREGVFQISEGYPSLERIMALREEYEEFCSQHKSTEEEFKSKISNRISLLEELLQEKEQLRNFHKQLSGFREKVENYKNIKETSRRSKEQLLVKMNKINSGWKGDFLKVINIHCDSLEQDKLSNLINDINYREDEKKQDERELESLRLQKEVLEKEINSLKTFDLGIFIRKYLYISLSVIFSGAVLFAFNKLLGGALALIGASIISLSFIIKFSSKGQMQVRKNNLDFQLSSINNRVKLQQDKLNEVLKDMLHLRQQLSYYSNKLDLKEEMSPTGLLQYFKDVQDIKREILNFGYSGKNADKLQQDISTDLMQINLLLSRILGEEPYEEKEILKYSEGLFEELEEVNLQLNYAENFTQSLDKLYMLENKIRTLLNIDDKIVLIDEVNKIIELFKTYNNYNKLKQKLQLINAQITQAISSEKMKKAFRMLFKDSHIIEGDELRYFYELCENYASYDQVEREYSLSSSELQETIKKLDSLKEERQILKVHLNNLSTSEKLLEAQRAIDESRTELKQLAVKFSVYSAAEYIMDSVQKKFIETAKDTILGGAGNIFSKITGGEYKAVLPGDNLLQADYKAMLKNEEIQSSTSILSRGTGEQLYLAVRINRIKEMKPKLPIILDDPFVNFDSLHTKNTLKVIMELSQDNQVFILTCHSELIKLISEISDNAQYWKLRSGKFELCNSDKLVEYLL